MRKLLEEEKQRLRNVFNDFSRVAELQTTEELHLLALEWNWDNHAEYLFSVIRNPNLDKGTALYLYWLSEPYYFHEKYSSVQEAEFAQAFDLGYMKLIVEIEERYCSGFYTTAQFAYNPRAAAPGAFRSDIECMALSQGKLKREIPELMCQAVEGEILSQDTHLYYNQPPTVPLKIAEVINQLLNEDKEEINKLLTNNQTYKTMQLLQQRFTDLDLATIHEVMKVMHN